MMPTVSGVGDASGEWCWWWVVLNGELREEEDGDDDMDQEV